MLNLNLSLDIYNPVPCACAVPACAGALWLHSRPEPGVMELTIQTDPRSGGILPSVLLDAVGIDHLIRTLQAYQVRLAETAHE